MKVRRRSNRNPIRIVFLALFLLGSVNLFSAVEFTWTGSVNNDWDNAGNWDSSPTSNRFPNQADDIAKIEMDAVAISFDIGGGSIPLGVIELSGNGNSITSTDNSTMNLMDSISCGGNSTIAFPVTLASDDLVLLPLNGVTLTILAPNGKLIGNQGLSTSGAMKRLLSLAR